MTIWHGYGAAHPPRRPRVLRRLRPTLAVVMGDTKSDPFHAKCVCGWSLERERRAANLPVANNRRIAETVASAHQNRPRFGDRAEETHVVTFTDPADPNA